MGDTGGVAGVDRGGGQGMFRRPNARGSSQGEGPQPGDNVKDARRAGHDTDEGRVRNLRPALVKKG